MPGWERLRHGGLLLDATRLTTLSRSVPGPLDGRIERQLRQRAGAIWDVDRADRSGISAFVAFVLEEVCGLAASTGDVDPQQPRLSFLGTARHHRRDGEATPPVDGPGRRGDCRCSWTTAGAWGSAGAAAS